MNGALAEQALLALRRRIPLGFALPDVGVDPTRMDPREYERYALISRPPEACARLLDAWLSLYAGAMLRRPSLAVAPRPAWLPGPLGQHAGESQMARAGRTRWGTSRNWSGAVRLACRGERFRSVTARWTVPLPALPKGDSLASPPPEGAWQSSTWVGLDGYRGFSRSLPQIGTVSEMTPSGVSTYAWTQWWVRGQKLPFARIDSFSVRPGDEIVATLEARPGWEEVAFSITCRPPPGDPRPVENRTFPMAAPVIGGAAVPVEGRTAVWCSFERPLTFADPPTLFPLPRLQPVAFQDALARVVDAEGQVGERDLTASRRIRMIGRAPGGRVLALATPAAPASAGKAPLGAVVSVA